MGILTRQQDATFVITSDKQAGVAQGTRAPARVSSEYVVWTGIGWSGNRADALQFDSLEAADEYVRANFAKVMG